MLCISLDRDVDDSCRSFIPCDGLGCSLAANVRLTILPIVTFFTQRLEINVGFGKLYPVASGDL